MNTYIGIDLGTSSLKLVLVTETGKLLSSRSVPYRLHEPRTGYSEQNPEDWFQAAKKGIASLLAGQEKNAVRAIGVAGQMHGLVMLDQKGKVIRPAILWNDGRSEKQCAYLNETFGREKLSRLSGNVAFAGFTLPKILWIKENEPQNFAQISKILVPKDYLNYRLTGEISAEPSDASGTLLYDPFFKGWSDELLSLTGLGRSVLPPINPSSSLVGRLKMDIANELGLSDDVKVAAGCGDNAGAALGLGVLAEGEAMISLGTSGTILLPLRKAKASKEGAIHTFMDANGNPCFLACILSAASALSWWESILSADDHAQEKEGLEPMLGKNDVYFLPYLSGERSPHNDVSARGAFIGMRHGTTRREMTLSVLEGVAFALRDCLEVAKLSGTSIKKARVSGGGAKSPLWRKIMTNVLRLEIEVPGITEGPSYGASILAMVGNGAYSSLEEAAKALPKVSEVVLPSEEIASYYDSRYAHWAKLYPALKGRF